jgi:hypothetical protein
MYVQQALVDCHGHRDQWHACGMASGMPGCSLFGGPRIGFSAWQPDQLTHVQRHCGLTVQLAG